jgi:hypothetical protein
MGAEEAEVGNRLVVLKLSHCYIQGAIRCSAMFASRDIDCQASSTELQNEGSNGEGHGHLDNPSHGLRRALFVGFRVKESGSSIKEKLQRGFM